MFKVLIAEDEPPIMRMIKSTLESVDSDFCVKECCINGKSAVEKLKNEDFDIVITDIKMPIMTGIELAGWIYQNKPDTKVIIVSGYSDFEYARKALEYKVFDDCTQEEINGLLNIILDTYTLNYPNHMKRKNTSVKKEFVNALASFVSYDAFIDDIISILATLRNDKRDPDRYEQLANEVEEYLINNYNKNITSDVLSKEFGFVPSYISRLFKRQKGVSPNEYVTKYRIEKAKKLIEENKDLRIKDIADAVGLKEAYYFSKTFKRETGMWPTEYSARDK